MSERQELKDQLVRESKAICPAVEKLDTFGAGQKRGVGWPNVAASNSAGVR